MFTVGCVALPQRVGGALRCGAAMTAPHSSAHVCVCVYIMCWLACTHQGAGRRGNSVRWIACFAACGSQRVAGRGGGARLLLVVQQQQRAVGCSFRERVTVYPYRVRPGLLFVRVYGWHVAVATTEHTMACAGCVSRVGLMCVSLPAPCTRVRHSNRSRRMCRHSHAFSRRPLAEACPAFARRACCNCAPARLAANVRDLHVHVREGACSHALRCPAACQHAQGCPG
jgi:hypothetical protein